ncbi:TetR/AcrR family transcriptional regulator [Bradyrhizobium prioriisuperbiae]|uniref:TetR/AcrR family transcriptional regulator n=1 Tax=Bradyrhizobium prioriisuperbiae TaxID=2854389 RepID=UPI0028ED6269|nr:TetR/AcrR family transcriptional regulator [Bradyrhizobium prioritasuperba]
MARYGAGHKQESRARIVAAAGRGFRKLGYGGIGVDGLAQEASVTHGAFYGHFKSKADAFQAAVVAGLQDLREGIEALRATSTSGWIRDFVGIYLGPKRTCDLAEACTLPMLSAEVERAEPATRTAYQTELMSLVAAIAAGLPNGTRKEREAQAWTLLALLAGGAMLARAVPEKALGARIAAAVQQAAIALSDERISRP